MSVLPTPASDIAVAAAATALTGSYKLRPRKQQPSYATTTIASTAKAKSKHKTSTSKVIKPRGATKFVECIACGDSLSLGGRLAIRTACKMEKHYYCRECLRHLLTLITKDESLYPLSCCGVPIPETKIKRAVSTYMLRKYKMAELAYNTPGKDRLYCPKPSCGVFIHLTEGIHLGEGWGKVTCPDKKCKTAVCLHCKKEAHMEDCSGDPMLKQVVDLGKTSGWMRCPRCWGMGERWSGCQYLSCTCGVYYCVRCGKEGYGGCGCPPV